jgi:ABC-type molybdate transport system substrate-binding protein
MSDADAEAAIIAAGANAGVGLPDLFLSKSFAAPNDLWLNHALLATEAPFAFANDSLVLYSSADKQANIKTTISTNGTLDNTKLLASLLKFSIPDPATNDPYGLAAKKVLGGFYPLLGNFMLKTQNSGASYAAVEFFQNTDGGTDFAFTGLSQICSAPAGVQEFEPGSKQYVFPSTSDIQLAGVKIANDHNQPNTAQYQELTDFVNFLKGTALVTSARTGKDTLAQHCYH